MNPFSRCWQWRASGVPSTLDLLDLAYNVLLPKISKDSSQPACCFSFWDSPKDLQGYLDPRGAAKHGRMPRERWQRLISQSVSQSRKTNLSILAVASHISLPKTCYCTRQSKTAPSLLFEKYSKTTRISLRKEQQNTEVGRVSGVSFKSVSQIHSTDQHYGRRMTRRRKIRWMRTGGEEETARRWRGMGRRRRRRRFINSYIQKMREGRRKGTLCVSLTLNLSLHVC